MKNLSTSLIQEAKDNLILLQNFLSNCLKQKNDSKTLVFSLKMFLYAIDIIDKKHYFAPFGIMIPLDSRIKKISRDKSFWIAVEKQTSIPLLHIDSILWMALSKDFSLKSEKILNLRSVLSEILVDVPN